MGFACTLCETPLWPGSDNASELAETIRGFLSLVPWSTRARISNDAADRGGIGGSYKPTVAGANTNVVLSIEGGTSSRLSGGSRSSAALSPSVIHARRAVDGPVLVPDAEEEKQHIPTSKVRAAVGKLYPGSYAISPETEAFVTCQPVPSTTARIIRIMLAIFGFMMLAALLLYIASFLLQNAAPQELANAASIGMGDAGTHPPLDGDGNGNGAAGPP